MIDDHSVAYQIQSVLSSEIRLGILDVGFMEDVIKYLSKDMNDVL